MSKGNILVIDDTVNHILSKHKNKLYLPSISEAKLLKLFQAIEWASKREAINNHNILVNHDKSLATSLLLSSFVGQEANFI
ncbi:hypothetical protein KP788_11710 [Streptococcus equi subsp. equi]|nr:hypothetical protein [Streptococcus equi subsp. equi]